MLSWKSRDDGDSSPVSVRSAEAVGGKRGKGEKNLERRVKKGEKSRMVVTESAWVTQWRNKYDRPRGRQQGERAC